MIELLRIGWRQTWGRRPGCFGLFAIALALTLVTNACSVGFSQSPKSLRIGMVVFPGYDIALYGETAEIFKRRGLRVDFVRFDNALDTTRALMRGSLDAAFTTLWDVMLADPSEDSPVVLMALDISAGSDGILAQPAIKTVADLRGKMVAAKLGSSTHLTLLEALKAHQVNFSEVEIVDYSNDVAAQKIEERAIDAAVLWEPVLSETAQSTQGNIIHTTKDLDSLTIDVMVSTKSTVKAHKAELQQFMLAWFDVMHAVETQPLNVFNAVGAQLGQTGASFAGDYAGLKQGNIALNQRMFAPDGRLKSAQAEIAQLINDDPRSGRVMRQDVEIDATLINHVMAEWKP